ncbi:hypothetical protein CPARA_2gp268 (nucleomorph) [Cryptomonas paramecium]|uniref:Uncharacterized protein n=1 Tax=Cryptomonas paramaecium TaxID=2898 RepID=F2HHY0_9CRYP|nr:hypothetical protein CPARA_2gp268 [Cryptomonas paramecium]AEA38926.1 hypothetical protein CPARA_2gp268 [Cryptomonas paramecium]
MLLSIKRIKNFIMKRNKKLKKISSEKSIAISKILDFLLIEIINKSMVVKDRLKNNKIKKRTIQLALSVEINQT